MTDKTKAPLALERGGAWKAPNPLSQRISIMNIYSPRVGGNRFPQLERTSLPSPQHYLTLHKLLSANPRHAWVAIPCPAHKGGAEKNPSLRVNIKDGCFKCMACGVSGGDIVALHQLRTGLGFIAAVRDLGGRFDV